MKPIPNFPGYFITKSGEVYSKKTGNRLKRMKICVDDTGYFMLRLMRGNRSYLKRVHRLLLETFVSPCPPGMEACHNDGIKSNIALSNLRWDTHKNNHKDRIKHDTLSCNQGEKNPRAILTKENVIKIKELLDQEELIQKEIAKMFGVTRSAINHINAGTSWSYIK